MIGIFSNKMKLFEVYPYWYMARNKKEALREIESDLGFSAEWDGLVEIVSEEDLKRLRYYLDDGNNTSISFEDRLAQQCKINNSDARLFATNLAEL